MLPLRLNLVQFYSFAPSCETFSCDTLFLNCEVAHVCERSIEIIRDGIVKEKKFTLDTLLPGFKRFVRTYPVVVCSVQQMVA